MSRPKILIVDDEPFNVDYLEQECEDMGYDTIAAGTGRQALEKVESESPDLVLLDIMMPVMDGFEVLVRLKADSTTRDIPVIIISAHNDLASIVKGIKMGAEDYLPKPFEPTLLQARISSSLEKKRLRDMQTLYLKSLQREMEIAREIQQGFLPAQLPDAPGWEIAAYFQAAREVAGDFYDAFLLPNGELVCVVGDVCGKGVGAALFMTLFRSLIRATCTSVDFSSRNDSQALPASERLHNAILFTNTYVAKTHAAANMFATLFAGIIDLREGRISYANCGNEAPLVFRNERVLHTLRPTGPVVGVFADAEFGVKEMVLERNDLLLAYTDGIPDALNPEDVAFGNERLLGVLAGSDIEPALLLERIQAQLRQFSGGRDQFDDITLLVVKRLTA